SQNAACLAAAPLPSTSVSMALCRMRISWRRQRTRLFIDAESVACAPRWSCRRRTRRRMGRARCEIETIRPGTLPCPGAGRCRGSMHGLPQHAPPRREEIMLRSSCALASIALVAALSSRGASADTFAYIGNADSNDISVFHVEPASGAIKAVETAPFPDVEKPGASTPLAVSPDQRLLFAGVRSEPYTVLSFGIDAKTGHLTYRGRGPLADSMANIATDRSGKFLLSASYGGSKVAINPIGADGIVGAPKQVIL